MSVHSSTEGDTTPLTLSHFEIFTSLLDTKVSAWLHFREKWMPLLRSVSYQALYISTKLLNNNPYSSFLPAMTVQLLFAIKGTPFTEGRA